VDTNRQQESFFAIILSMFNLFKKSYKDITEYPDTWSVAQSVREGKPIFIRFRVGIQDAIGHPKYPFQIGVAVPLIEPTMDGLTINAEAEELNKIEDELDTVLSQDNQAIFVLAITTNGMREFVFYSTEWKPEIFEQKVKSVNVGRHELQFMMQHDKNWDTFRQFSV